MTERNILVVDDDVLSQILLKNVITKGFPDVEVVLAGSGKEAMEVIGKTLNIHVIITDIAMFGMDGYHLMEKIRQGGRLDCPVIVVSGHKEDKIMARLERSNLPVFAVIVKPFSLREMKQTVARALLE